jgi:hypothetical protein
MLRPRQIGRLNQLVSCGTGQLAGNVGVASFSDQQEADAEL